MTKPSFGDHVRIIVNETTTAAGVAGLEGTVSGFTTPSETDIEVIGQPTDDYAVAVMFESRNDATFWFAEDLIEFLDHAPGTEIWLGGSPFKVVRNLDGSWRQVTLNSPRKRWWQFW